MNSHFRNRSLRLATTALVASAGLTATALLATASPASAAVKVGTKVVVEIAPPAAATGANTPWG